MSARRWRETPAAVAAGMFVAVLAWAAGRSSDARQRIETRMEVLAQLHITGAALRQQIDALADAGQSGQSAQSAQSDSSEANHAADSEVHPTWAFDGVKDTYCRLLAQLTVKASNSLFVTLDDRYFDIDTTHGHLFGVETVFVPMPELSFAARYSRSGGGNLDSALASVRFDYFHGLHWLGGATDGHSAPGVFEHVFAGNSGDLRQYFVGLGVPWGKVELTLMSEWLDLDGNRQRALTLVVSVPLPTARSP